jgi:uncharacterized Zn finger protein (UPF0148 family)
MGASEEEYFCIVCGKRLFSPRGETECSFCGKKENGDYACPDGHYVCEACRLASAEDLVEKTCETAKQTDPMEIALLLMKHPAIPIHGSENHLVTAYSLLTALRNARERCIGRREFARVAQRLKKASHGICGSWGVCGCAIAAGAVTSIVTGATYLSDKERSLALRVASKILDRIARPGGPRCCKMATYLAIEVAVESFSRELGNPIRISRDPKPCIFSKLNAECLRGRCPYHGEERRELETSGF